MLWRWIWMCPSGRRIRWVFGALPRLLRSPPEFIWKDEAVSLILRVVQRVY
jgi:hypothetical protein